MTPKTKKNPKGAGRPTGVKNNKHSLFTAPSPKVVVPPTTDGIQIPVTPVFERNLAAQELTIVDRGSARSSKSYSIGQLFVMYGTSQEHKNFLVTRKTMPALKMTSYKLIIDLLKEYNYYEEKNHSMSSPYSYRLGTNTYWFVSVDDKEKIKSTEFNYIWMEEANEFTYDEYNILKLRLSGKTQPGERNHIFLSFNPTDANGFIPTKLMKQKDVIEIHSTYKDNPFLEPDYISIVENLKEEDPNYYKIYALGEYGAVEHIIYRSFDNAILEGEPDDLYYGLDFGYNAPTALIEIKVKDKIDVYLREVVYENKLLTKSDHPSDDTLIKRMEQAGVGKKKRITADSEDPKTIEEIYKCGYNIHPAVKGPDSVRNGIGVCQRKRFHIHPESVNLQKEIQGYKWKQDKNGIVLDEPVSFLNHGMDATRYGIVGVEGITKFSYAFSSPAQVSPATPPNAPRQIMQPPATPTDSAVRINNRLFVVSSADPTFRQKIQDHLLREGNGMTNEDFKNL